eukprot:783202-Rhodomonas_salina.1
MVPVHLLLCPRHSACSLNSRECQLRHPYTVTTNTAALRSRISVQQLQHWSAYSQLCSALAAPALASSSSNMHGNKRARASACSEYCIASASATAGTASANPRNGFATQVTAGNLAPPTHGS